jgi:dienelactone hydrolase
MPGYRAILIAAVFVLAMAGSATAQSPIVFPAGPVPFAASAARQTILFRPAAGSGPWSAVVLLPTCGGVSESVYDWARRLTEAGRLALIVDSNSPRGVGNNCQGAASLVTQRHVAEDAAAALAYLRGLPMAKPDRLAVVGFSWGAMAAAKMSGADFQARLTPALAGLRAIVAFYPGCGTAQVNAPLHVVESYAWGGAVAIPLLLALGAKDDDTPAHFCTDRADRLRSSGQPVSYKVYADATHAFDGRQFGTAGRTVPLGGNRGTTIYRYNPSVTEAAAADLRDFLAAHLD